jgi:negative regulator of flagellin synthesis FlgM
MSDPLMPIDLRQLTTGQTGASNQGKAVARDNQAQAKTPSPDNSTSSDSVQVSDKARLVGKLIQDLSAKPEVDSEKVEKLKTAIASGEFSVSTSKVASKMLQLEDGLRKLST